MVVPKHVPLSLLLLLTTAATRTRRVHSQEQPVCTAGDEVCGSRSSSSASEGDSSGSSSSSSQCGLWLAPSTLGHGFMGIFAGEHLSVDEVVATPGIHIPILDSNPKEFSIWQEISWDWNARDDVVLQNHFHGKSFKPGVGTNVLCNEDLRNIAPAFNVETEETTNVHRATHPAAGSFSYRNGLHFHTLQDVQPGQELFMSCQGEHWVDPIYQPLAEPQMASIEWIEANAVCIDHLTVQPSTIPNIGQGAFARKNYKQGETIVSSPVVVFDRSQMEIVEQSINPQTKDVEYTEIVKQHQLLLNYCYGSKDSTVLVLPYGPGVNFINHAPTTVTDNDNGKTANAVLAWSDAEFNDKEALSQPATEAITSGRGLIIDYVALRDIQAGEEIFLDYGQDWQDAWNEHLRNWKAGSDDYQSAAQYIEAHPEEVALRTQAEQETDPYPDNLRVACNFVEDYRFNDVEPNEEEDAEEVVYWTWDNDDCLRPCQILDREFIDHAYYYTVKVEQIQNHFTPEYCQLSHKTQTVLQIPESAISLVNKEYTSDQFLPNAFRHEIGVPAEYLYPQNWKMEDPEPMGDFVTEGLELNQLEKIKWKKNGEIVTPHAYLMRQNPKIRQTLLEYCDKMGITERFRDLTYRGNALPAEADTDTVLGGLNWYIQRPPPHWQSNMHWISPLDGDAQDDFLRALSAAGFDEVLEAIGDQLGLDGLACYHLSFIGVSSSTKGYMHYDITNSGARVYNVIMPLILANQTGPELDVASDEEEGEVGRLRYEYDVASLMGDDAYHATSAVDYRVNKEMRMAATVYIADIREDNIDAIMNDYTQHYPPKDRPDILMGMAGIHWKRNDPSAKLPKPNNIETEASVL